MRVVLDAEAVNAIVEPHHATRQVRRVMQAAHRLRRDVAVAAVTLAELYRGAGRSQALDGLLARESEAIVIRDTDRALARLVGCILAQGNVGSSHLADAHAVALAVEAGGGIIVTGDPDDLAKLAAPYRFVVIESIA